jgi:hypothetical protein
MDSPVKEGGSKAAVYAHGPVIRENIDRGR